jgi:hypothetical protein
MCTVSDEVLPTTDNLLPSNRKCCSDGVTITGMLYFEAKFSRSRSRSGHWPPGKAKASSEAIFGSKSDGASRDRVPDPEGESRGPNRGAL